MKIYKALMRGTLSLMLFLGTVGTLSFYYQGIEIVDIGIYFGSIAFLINAFLFPYGRHIKSRLFYLITSLGAFWIFHLVLIIWSNNWIQWFPNLALLIVMIGFIFVYKRIQVLIPLICLISFLFIGSKILSQNSKVNIENLIREEPLNGEYFRNENKVQIIEFWYSSCVICIENFGEFEKFYLKNKDNYDITSVNVEIPADKLNNFIPKKYVQQKGYSFPVLELTQEYVEKNYQIFSTPKTVIILNDTIIFKENIIVSDLLISKILKDIDK